VTVRGAGIIGLAVAEELIRRGHDVTVVDPAPASGATHAAAGMLSPATEVWHGEADVLRLGAASLRLWPAFARRLGVPLEPGGTLLVGVDRGDAQQVERQGRLLTGLGRRVDTWTATDVRAAEPSRARIGSGLHLADEPSVDPRRVCAALLERVTVVRTAAVPDADVTVVATGARLPAPYTALVRAVRGEIVRLRSDDPPARTVRAWVAGEPVYLVPRRAAARTGPTEVVVGATSEEHDEPPVVTAGGVLRLLAAARVVWPALDRAELVEAVARDRPATVDGLPLVGPTGRPGEILAAGHYRHGVLLAPLTARLVADLVETRDPETGEPGVVDPALDPRRFSLAPDGRTS